MKQCFKCNLEKPISEFYIHPRMADGHLNKCKECTKKDTSDRVARKKLDPEWIEYELDRQRMKSRKLSESDNVSPISTESRRIYLQRHRFKHPEKDKSRRKFALAVSSGKIIRQSCEICGDTNSQGHHEDYSHPFDVVWLCTKHHAERHVEIRRLKRLNKLLTDKPNSDTLHQS